VATSHRTRERDEAEAKLVHLYDGGATPESAAKALLADHEEGPVYEAVEHAAQFSEHYFGAQNDEWTAAVRAALARHS
jgi:hypothetical protein